jgi:hypothetical protein
MSKPKFNRIVSLTEEEDKAVAALQEKGVAVNEIFRRGLQSFANACSVSKQLSTKKNVDTTTSK